MTRYGAGFFSTCVWRLTYTLNKNMDIDTYREQMPGHFARMFINIDTRPQIWQTSWRVDDMIEMHRNKLRPEDIAAMPPNDLWVRLNQMTFTKSSH